MATNIATMSYTNHVDIRYKYVNQYVEDGVDKMVFVKSTNNDSDILTKNLSAEIHEKHSNKTIGKKL